MVLGLPLHPLLVHAAVVLVPLSALMMIVAVAVPWWRGRYGGLSVLAAVFAAGAALAARASGEALADVLTEPEPHALFGTLTTLSAGALAVFAVGWWFLSRRDASRSGQRGVLGALSGALAVGAALAGMVFVVLAGHSGATATWTARLDASTASPAPAASETTYSMADVAAHASEESCWVAVDGGVYDLTDWIGQHPGGRQRILNLCGTDATTQFRTQHDSARRPNAALDARRIGRLG